MDDKTVLTPAAIEVEGLVDWRDMLGELHARFDTGDFATGLALVDGLGAAAEAANHHPDVDLHYGEVYVRLSSHDSGGVTQRDVRLAREISSLAAQAGATATPDRLRAFEMALDVDDLEAVKPFWAAVLGFEPGADDRELKDPGGRLPTLWFQQVGQDRVGEAVPPQRFHYDVRVPPEVAPTRIQAALDAGGRLMSDAAAPAYTVLADARGNQACITTWQGRD